MGNIISINYTIENIYKTWKEHTHSRTSRRT